MVDVLPSSRELSFTSAEFQTAALLRLGGGGGGGGLFRCSGEFVVATVEQKSTGWIITSSPALWAPEQRVVTMPFNSAG